MKPTLKDVLTNDNWVITKILQGTKNKVRIDATRRQRVADGVNTFSEWGTVTYIDSIRIENGKCKIKDSSKYCLK